MKGAPPLSLMEILIAIKKTLLFRELPGEAVKRLSEFVGQKQVSAGQIIFLEGELGEEMYFLHRGQVRLQRKLDREGSHLKDLGPGEHFGEMAIIDGSPRSATAAAEVDCLLLVLGRTGFETAVRDYPDIAFDIFRELARRLREAEAGLRESMSPQPD